MWLLKLRLIGICCCALRSDGLLERVVRSLCRGLGRGLELLELLWLLLLWLLLLLLWLGLERRRLAKGRCTERRGAEGRT